MANTKIDIIQGAYSQLKISGLSIDPTPEDVTLALLRLENMAAELEARNICIGYNIEEEPDPNDFTNVLQHFWHMLETNLAVRLVPDFGKELPQTLMAQASQSLSTASSISAADSVRMVEYPRRMARGSGNDLRFNRWQRFQRPDKLPPNECATNTILIGDINDYEESFEAYLNSAETITSFVIASDIGLTIVSSSNDDPLISYRVEAINNVSDGRWQQIKIVVTTDTGRITTRIINFEILSNDTINGV